MKNRTLGQLLDDSINRFKAVGIQSARLDARLLIELVLGWNAGQVIGNLDHVPTSSQCNELEAIVLRRLGHEPIALILGYKEFWSLDFFVTKDVLIPRPDSETIVEAVLKNNVIETRNLLILDLGTGTGCLLLSLLSELPKAQGIGVDVSPQAIKVAQKNARNLGINGRSIFQCSDWDSEVEGLFDIVISNPPYISEGDYFKLDREITGFEPKLALLGGADGLSCYRNLSAAIVRKLAFGGRAFIEIASSQLESVGAVLSQEGLEVCEVHKDLAGHFRVIEAELLKSKKK